MAHPATSVGITGFLDILGFGDRVLRANTDSDIAEIARLVARIRSHFDYKTKDALIRDVHSLYEKTVLAFTDCVIVNIPLQSDATKYGGTFDPIMSELVGFAYAQGTCAQEKLFIRGGVDIGWWHRSGSTLISQSMVRAYKAEGKACVPVIALTHDLYAFFSEHRDRGFYSQDADPVASVLRRYELEEGDGFWYLDYISICAESIGWQRGLAQMDAYRSASPDGKEEIMEKGYRENIDLWFGLHAKNIEEAYTQAAEAAVKAKYDWLATYHNEVAAKFTTNPDVICRVAS